MAGVHSGGILNGDFQGASTVQSLSRWPKAFPGTPADRAYSDGLRVANAGITGATNPFTYLPATEYRRVAWNTGYVAGGAGNTPGILYTVGVYAQTNVGRPAAP
jgi:hypothetical protein